MRIAFDATTLQPPLTGVGYYTRHLLGALLKAGGGHEVLLLSHRPLEEPWKTLGSPASREGFLSSRNLWLQWTAPKILRRVQPEVAHFTNSLVPRMTECRLVVTVHDMSLRLFPALHPWRRRLLEPLVRASLRRARRVITVSESSRRDIIRYSGIPALKVVVVHAAAASEFRPIQDDEVLNRARSRYQLPDRFLLYLGTFEPRKNVARLLEAYLRLPDPLRRDCPLLLAGASGWGLRKLRRNLERSAFGPEVRTLGYVPYEDLPALLNLAEAFVFPSLYEGFGLPVIEAMACGTPVVTSSTSSLEELFQNAALLADPEDVQEIRKALRTVLESRDLRRELSQKGIARAGAFSWEKAAQETLEVYRAAISNR